jgi:hypothetical protein
MSALAQPSYIVRWDQWPQRSPGYGLVSVDWSSSIPMLLLAMEEEWKLATYHHRSPLPHSFHHFLAVCKRFTLTETLYIGCANWKFASWSFSLSGTIIVRYPCMISLFFYHLRCMNHMSKIREHFDNQTVIIDWKRVSLSWIRCCISVPIFSIEFSTWRNFSSRALNFVSRCEWISWSSCWYSFMLSHSCLPKQQVRKSLPLAPQSIH